MEMFSVIQLLEKLGNIVKNIILEVHQSVCLGHFMGVESSDIGWEPDINFSYRIKQHHVFQHGGHLLIMSKLHVAFVFNDIILLCKIAGDHGSVLIVESNGGELCRIIGKIQQVEEVDAFLLYVIVIP